MKIKTKLMLGFILIGLIPMAIVTVISLNKIGTELETQAFQKLEAVVANKKNAVQIVSKQYLADIKSQQGRSLCTKAMPHYQNHIATGEKTPEYIRYANIISNYVKETGYYDFFVLDMTGHCVYSAFKESDYNTNLLTGEYSSSGLGKAVKRAMAGETAFEDFTPYAPSNGAPAAFLAAPIISAGKQTGVVALQVSIDAINNIMQEATGMGKSGEAYLVGPDKRMRSDSRIDPEGHSVLASFTGTIEKNGVDTEAAIEALKGNTDGRIIMDYTGNPVFSSYSPIDILGVNWAILAEINEDEVLEPTIALRNTILLILAVIMLIVVFFAFFFARSINKGIINVIEQIKTIIDAAINGKLDTRGDPDAVIIDFKEVVIGINDILDALIAPLNVTAEYVDRISKGDMPPQITEDYKGDFNEIKNNLNQLMTSIGSVLTEMSDMSENAVAGKLDNRGDASLFQGDFAKMIQGTNDILDAVIAPLNVTAEYVDRISKGDMPPQITEDYKGDFNEIKNNLNQLMTSIGSVLSEMSDMSKNAVVGKLDNRGDSSLFQGDFAQMIQGVNDILDAVIAPLNVTAEYVDRISKGDMPPQITEEYKGDFNEIKNNLNQLMTSITQVINEMSDVTDNALAGNLSERADASKFQGDFAKLIQGTIDILDAVATPIDEAGQVLSTMADGDLTVQMTGSYNGDFGQLKNDINQLASSLNDVIVQVNDVVSNTSSAAVELSATSETLAASAQQQNAQADDVASAVEEMARTVSDNAEGATRTADLAKTNADVAKDGGIVVEQTVEKMGDIANVVAETADNIKKLGEASLEIGEIISVIDDISDQTNLLALNAAIEAARAGEHGRGFAVVADEVRKLAERTTGATKQIADMIKGIQKGTNDAVIAMEQGTKEVEAGRTLTDEAGKALKEILSSSYEVTDMVSQIAAASEEQSATTEEISKNVVGISQASAESARQITDVAGTSESLAELTEHLGKLMEQFKVSSNSSAGSLNAYNQIDSDDPKMLN